MNSWGLIDTLNVVSVFFLFFFSFFLLTHKKGKSFSNRILGLFLFVMAFSILSFVLVRENRLPLHLVSVFLFMNCFNFLIGPLLYLYVKSVAYYDYGWQKNHLIHALPFIGYLLFLVANFIFVPSGSSSLSELSKNLLSGWRTSLVSISLSGQLLFYFGASFLALKSYRSRLKNSFSSLEKLNLSWLNLILGGFGLIWLIGVFNFTGIGVWSGNPSPVLIQANKSIILGLAILIVFKGLKRPEIFSGIEEKPKYEKSFLTEEEMEKILGVLKDHMRSKKPYLVPGLSLKVLAKGIAVAPRILSQTINSRLGKNFVDFINSFRIEEAKNLLSQSGANGKTILDIAYDSGFNSKSVFNSAFKKHAGMTPKEFRKKERRKAEQTEEETHESDVSLGI